MVVHEEEEEGEGGEEGQAGVYRDQTMLVQRVSYVFQEVAYWTREKSSVLNTHLYTCMCVELCKCVWVVRLLLCRRLCWAIVTVVCPRCPADTREAEPQWIHQPA